MTSPWKNTAVRNTNQQSGMLEHHFDGFFLPLMGGNADRLLIVFEWKAVGNQPSDVEFALAIKINHPFVVVLSGNILA